MNTKFEKPCCSTFLRGFTGISLTRLNRVTGVTNLGLCIVMQLLISVTGLTAAPAVDVSAIIAKPIKDIANMQELEGSTFHVINITEHDSVLPAELRLAGKEADWAEGISGYVDGKEVPTGLIPGDQFTRLMVCVPLEPKEVKKVTFKKGKSAAVPDLKVEQDGNRVIVSNQQASWTLGPNGLEQFQSKEKTFGVQEAGISNGTLKATLTPAVCRVTLQTEGAGAREYLFYPNSSLWQVNADRNYLLSASGTNAFYYSHPCGKFIGDPGSPYGGVIKTDELEKGGGGIKGLKEFHLFSAADWGLLMGDAIGLGIYPNPSVHTILVDATKRSAGLFVQAVPIDKRSIAILKYWHGCGWWRTREKPLGNMINYIFGVVTDVNAGNVQRSMSLAPVVLRSLGDRSYGAQLPWITTSQSETICVEDLDGNGPDMLNDRWHFSDSGKRMSCFEFHDVNKDGQLDDVEIYAKWDDKGNELDVMESKHPVVRLHDWTRDGKIVANCVFFGGRIDQDWVEFNTGISYSPPDRAILERKKPFKSNEGWENVKVLPLEVQKFDRISRVLDLDGDGDMDVLMVDRRVDDVDTDYTMILTRQFAYLDRYDSNPFHGILLDPFTGCLTVIGCAIILGPYNSITFRYKGLSVAGMDAVSGNMCLDGDGLPEAKTHFNAGLFDDYFVFQPESHMIGSSLYLSNRHALGKINHQEWQEYSCTCCYNIDVGLFTIRKNASWPWCVEHKESLNTRKMPKRKVTDSITTYRDKWGNEIRFVGLMQLAKWDGRLVDGSKDPATVKDWRDAFHYDWDYLLATFDGLTGLAGESGYTTHYRRWEFCPDYAQRREAKLFYSELDGRLHLKGAIWGHYTPYLFGNPNPNLKKAPLDEAGRDAHIWTHEGYFILDCDFMRYYAPRHEAFFDEDRDGYLDSFLVDADHDGWYEDRAWYDRDSRTVACMKNGILVLWPRQLDPWPEEELLFERYDKLVALKQMSEEKKSVLKSTVINFKAQSPAISVAGTNLWLGVDADLLPQVLLDTVHCDTNIWRDLSPKGYSRLLTGLQRQKVVVREMKEKWSEESLRGAAALFLAPPYTAKPDADELKAMDSFLKGGGRVVVACPDWSVEPKGEVYALQTGKALVPGDNVGEWGSPLGIELALKWEEPDPYRVKINICPKWDKTYFYFFAEVYDRDLINKETGETIWKDDSIQFALGDLGLTWRDYPWGIGPAEVCAKGGMRQEYGIARTAKGAEIYRWIDVPGNRTGPVAGVKVQVTRENNRTVYQLALPWTEVGKTDVKAGATFGFALWVWDRERFKDAQIQHMSMGNLKWPNQFRKMIFMDTPEAAKAYAGAHAGAPVESLLDAMCAAYGIHRNPEHTALVAVIDPHFRNRGLGPEVWERFKEVGAGGMMKDVRKLFFSGSSLGVSGAAEPLLRYRDKIIGASSKVGKGELLVFCSEMMLNNSCSCFLTFAFEGGDCGLNDLPSDKLIDAKPDNNVFVDNLARYVVADQKKFKVLKCSDKRATVEISGPGKVYVNKGTKIVSDGKEAINGKESGNTVCFEVPASKAPIKLRIK